MRDRQFCALVASCGSEHQGINGTGTSAAEHPGDDGYGPPGVPVIIEEQKRSPSRDAFGDLGRYREGVDDRTKPKGTVRVVCSRRADVSDGAEVRATPCLLYTSRCV